MTGAIPAKIPTPGELRKLCEEYYPSRKNGFDVLDTPDTLLAWLLGVLHGSPVPAPEIPVSTWESLIRLLDSHSVLPYIYYCLREARTQCRPPEPVLKIMQARFLQSSYSADCAVKQIAEITSACEDRGIRVIVMKGVALGQTVYPHPATRTGSDIDLLVSPVKYGPCRDLLLDLGYHLGYDTFRVMPEFYHHACFLPGRKQKDQKVIELHWRPIFLPGPGHEVSPDALCNRAELTRTGYGAIHTLSPPDAFFHTAIHMCLAHEPQLHLSWVTDISLLAREISNRGMWPEVMARSTEWQGTFAAGRAVTLAGYWTGLTLPDDYICTKWPAQGPGDEFALHHMQERRAGREFLLHQIVAGFPGISKKVRVIYHWTFRPDLMYGGYKEIPWWEVPSAHMKMLYNNYQQIRKIP